MALDKVTEFISHFIGSFFLTETEGRLREQPDAFNHIPDTAEEYEPHQPDDLLLRAPYDTVGHMPGLTPFWFQSTVPTALPYAGDGPAVANTVFGFRLDTPNILVAELRLPSLSGNTQYISFAPPPPPSAASLVHQINVLSDNDLLLSEQGAVFVTPGVYGAQLDLLVARADDVSPSSAGAPLQIAQNAPDSFNSIVVGYQQLYDGAPEGAQVALLTGSDAVGVVVDGTSADEMPVLNDVLPEHFQEKEVEETGEVPHPIMSDDSSAQISAEVFDVEDGHQIVGGGNLLINETVLVSRPVDADVIAVMGDVVSLAAISQVNILQDINAGVGDISPSQAINAATMAFESSASDDASGESLEGLPVGWGVTRLEADLVSVNWMHQFNYITDHDRAEITFSGEDTYINIGGNTGLNQVSLLEIAWGYDLIIVGGKMIDMSLIQQTNVLLDSDSVHYDGEWPAVVSVGDNLLFNSATISEIGVDAFHGMKDAFADAGEALADGAASISAELAQDAMFAGTPFLSVLYIAGDLINITSVEQTNILGDADQIAVHLAELDERPEEPDGPLTVTTGSNAVINIATILENGLDSTVLVGGDVYDDLLLHQANLIETDDNPFHGDLAPLANEAVAFLADDLMSDSAETDDTLIVASGDSGASPDVMQTVLA